MFHICDNAITSFGFIQLYLYLYFGMLTIIREVIQTLKLCDITIR